MKSIKVIVLCHNASGEPEFHSCTIDVSEDQYDNGEHYDLAKENAVYNGFMPLHAFDAQDRAASQLADLSVWIAA